MRAEGGLNKKIFGAKEFFYLLLVCFLWFTTLTNIVMVSFDKFLHAGMYFRTDGKVIFAMVFLLFSLPYMGKKLKLLDYVFFLFLVILYLLTYWISGNENEYLETYLNGFLLAVPMFLVGRTFDFPTFKKVFYYITVISIITVFYYSLFFIQSDSYQGDVQFTHENMAMAYGLLPHVLFMIWYSFDFFSAKKIISWLNLGVTFIGLFTILMLGTRGPVICVVLFLVYYFLFFKKPKHKHLYRFLLVVSSILIFIFLEKILLFFAEIAFQYGFSERVFESLLTENLASSDGSSGRTDFYTVLLKALNNSPIWGYGFFGSYYFVHSYPHNIFLDLLFSFGYFFGGGFILYLFYAIYKSFRKIDLKDENGFMCVLIGTGIITLLFSDTFVVSPYFFMCVGYSIQLSQRKKQLSNLTTYNK